VEKESLLKRGLDAEELVESLELIDQQGVSHLMATNGLQLIF